MAIKLSLLPAITLTALAYFVTGRLGLMLPYVGSHVTLIWLPTGIAVYALLTGGLRLSVAVFLGAFLVNLSIGASLLLSLFIAVGNTFGPVVTYGLLNKFGLNLNLIRMKDVFLIVVASAIGMVLSASNGVANLLYAGIVDYDNLITTWVTWWAGDTVGVYMVLPLLLAYTKKSLNELWQSKVTFLSLSILALIIQFLTFFADIGTPGQISIIAIFVLPIIVWVAMRLGLVASSSLALCIAVCAILITINKNGPFYQIDIHQGLISLWVYVCVLILTTIIIHVMQSERVAFEDALIASENKHKAVIEGALDAIISINNKGEIIEFNPAAEKIFGYRRNEVMGRPLSEVIIPPSVREAHQKGHQQFIVSGEKRLFDKRIELTAMRADGSEFPVELTLTSIETGGAPIVTGFIRDITIQKNAEESINQLAFYEPLTGLPNRRLFLDRLNQAFAHSAREKSFGAILFIDLDNFKSLNDTRGHEVGDKLLIQVAERIKSHLREYDTVSRLGGDEFVVLLQNLKDNAEMAELFAREIAEMLLHAISMPYRLDGVEHHSSSSIGVCMFNGYEVTQDELLKRADTAMYQAKSNGRNTLCFYNPQMQQAFESKTKLQEELRNALELNQLALYYQIQVDKNKTVIGVEALLRWVKPGVGMVSPDDFIPMAEETGLIIPFGLWVIEKACQQLKSWEANEYGKNVRLAVNVSAKQFRQSSFVHDLKKILEKTGADPSLLKIELTESVVVDDVTNTALKMQELRLLGVSFAMDDFGTGYSSLIYLKKLPLTQIKIDQSFVRDITIDTSDAEIVKAIVLMAQALDFNVIAEGVETEEQFDLLRQYGCKEFQGYYFGRPVEIEALNELLAHRI